VLSGNIKLQLTAQGYSLQLISPSTVYLSLLHFSILTHMLFFHTFWVTQLLAEEIQVNAAKTMKQKEKTFNKFFMFFDDK
jgi:hypothetical protein